jgi:predicted lipid-binding transport protein (Tim44 family)
MQKRQGSKVIRSKFHAAGISLFLLTLTFPIRAFARAGGAGGGSGSSSGGISGYFFGFIFDALPFPVGLILIGIAVLVVYLMKEQSPLSPRFDSIPSLVRASQKKSKLPASFLKRNPSFSEVEFKKKVEFAFLEIQKAWMAKDLRKVRRWISDGVWQRFNIQIKMMNVLEQKNVLSDITIHNTFIDNVEVDGSFDIIHVGIHFSMNDSFISDQYPELNLGGPVEGLEYWTFLRKSRTNEFDLFHRDTCPKCGDQLPLDLGEVSRCQSCKTLTTLGEYDWLLAEIEQADDYLNIKPAYRKSGRLTSRIRKALGNDSGFSVQLIEDRASNAYMQVLASLVLQKPELIRRFTSDEFFKGMKDRIQVESPFVYRRLFLNSVTLIDFFQLDGFDNLVIAIKKSGHRLGFNGKSIQFLQRAQYTVNEFLVLTRRTGAAQQSGSLLTHNSVNCGGPVGDTLDLKCPNCGMGLNNSKLDWVVTELLSPQEYIQYKKQNTIRFVTGFDVDELDPAFTVRDFALNNIIYMTVVEGDFSFGRLDLIYKFAIKLGYNKKRIRGMIDLSKGRALGLRIPENRKQSERVYKIMVNAAKDIGYKSSGTQAILDEMKQRVAL